MSKIPVPPKRSYKNRISTQHAPEILSNPVGGSGYMVARSMQDTAFDFDPINARPPKNLTPKETSPKPHHDDRGRNNASSPQSEFEPVFVPTLHDILDEAPDVVIGEDVEIKGDFQFDGLLHLKGRFEGRLLSEGDVYLGPKAVLKSNLTHINRLIIDGGHVIGRISVQQLGIAGPAFVKGDISCKYLEVNSDECTLLGKVYVHPNAPEVVEFPRERLPVKEDVIPVAPPSPAKPVQPPKETTEISTQASVDPDEILTPAELALRAKLEAKERRKEAKRQQQEEALRQSHGLAPLSPEKVSVVPHEETNAVPSSNAEDTNSQVAEEPMAAAADAAKEPTAAAADAADDTTAHVTDSPIKLVSSDIGQPENASPLASQQPSPVKSSVDTNAAEALEDSLDAGSAAAVDDIASPQKTVREAVIADGDGSAAPSTAPEDAAEPTQDTVQAAPEGSSDAVDDAEALARRLIAPPSPEQRRQAAAEEEESAPAAAPAQESDPTTAVEPVAEATSHEAAEQEPVASEPNDAAVAEAVEPEGSAAT